MPPFQFVEINGLRLPSPQHAYSALYEVRMREPARLVACLLACCSGVPPGLPSAHHRAATIPHNPTLQALTGDRAGPQTAAAALEEMFSAGGGGAGRKERRPCVVLVDEMDLLVNKTQVGACVRCVCASSDACSAFFASGWWS